MRNFEKLLDKIVRLSPKWGLRLFTKEELRESFSDFIKDIEEEFYIIVVFPKEVQTFELIDAVIKYLYDKKQWSLRDIGEFLGKSHEWIRQRLILMKDIKYK